MSGARAHMKLRLRNNVFRALFRFLFVASMVAVGPGKVDALKDKVSSLSKSPPDVYGSG